jgi:preprotein translocase subunit SecA
MSDLDGIYDRINRVNKWLREEQRNADKRYVEIRGDLNKINETLEKHRDRMYRLELRLKGKKNR